MTTINYHRLTRYSAPMIPPQNERFQDAMKELADTIANKGPRHAALFCDALVITALQVIEDIQTGPVTIAAAFEAKGTTLEDWLDFAIYCRRRADELRSSVS